MRCLLLLLFLSLLGLAGPGCQTTERVTELTIEQEVTIDFEAVLADVAEEVIVPFDDMRTESRYVDLRPLLVCVGLDVEKTQIVITSLEGIEALPLDFSIALSRPDQNNWIPLATFSGNVASGTVVRFADADVTIGAMPVSREAARSSASNKGQNSSATSEK